MKVRCIADNDGEWYVSNWPVITRILGWIVSKKPRPANGPKKNDILTVTNEHWNEGKKYYFFKEWPSSGAFHSINFKPIDEKYDTVTFEEIKEKASIN